MNERELGRDLLEFSAASQRPSRLKASASIPCILLATISSSCPVLTSQNLTLSSQLPDASFSASALKATEVTQLACPCRVRSNTNSCGEPSRSLIASGMSGSIPKMVGSLVGEEEVRISDAGGGSSLADSLAASGRAEGGFKVSRVKGLFP